MCTHRFQEFSTGCEWDLSLIRDRNNIDTCGYIQRTHTTPTRTTHSDFSVKNAELNPRFQALVNDDAVNDVDVMLSSLPEAERIMLVNYPRSDTMRYARAAISHVAPCCVQCLNPTPALQFCNYSGSGSTALFSVGWNGSVAMAAVLIRHGAKVNWLNTRQNKPISLAIERDHVRRRLLIFVFLSPSGGLHYVVILY